jgi:thiamine pyrophosphokinase
LWHLLNHEGTNTQRLTKLKSKLKKCIILANGRPHGKSIVTFLQKQNYLTLICADGGANHAKKLGLIPDFIIGDLDSIKPETLNHFKQKSKVIKITRQNDTDVEKCLKYAISKKFSNAILLGVTGNRLDHTFCNLGIVIKFFNKIKIKIIAENSILTPYSGSVKLTTIPGETISLYAFNRKTKITSSGLRYPLRNNALPFGERESTSNIALSDKVNLNIKGGIVFVIRNFTTVKKLKDKKL